MTENGIVKDAYKNLIFFTNTSLLIPSKNKGAVKNMILENILCILNMRSLFFNMLKYLNCTVFPPLPNYIFVIN